MVSCMRSATNFYDAQVTLGFIMAVENASALPPAEPMQIQSANETVEESPSSTVGPLPPALLEDPAVLAVSTNPTQPASTENPSVEVAPSVAESSGIESAEAEFPDGVDPAFLAALPEDLRREVIEDQRRRQSLQQSQARAAAAAAQPAPPDVAAPVLEVAPEFLAALPPEIQEEVNN